MHPREPHVLGGHRLSIGRLLVEVVMIVFSILLALSLESYHERRQHRELAATALERIHSEMADNADSIRKVLPVQEKVLDVFARLAANPDLRLGPEDNLPLGLNPPTLSTTAYEAALATQASSYMRYDDVLAFSRAYNLQRRMALVENGWVPLLISPFALDERHRSDFYSLKHGLLGEYREIEKQLLKMYDGVLTPNGAGL